MTHNYKKTRYVCRVDFCTELLYAVILYYVFCWSAILTSS